MRAAPSLLELQQSFAACAVGGTPSSVLTPWIAGQGLTPEARLQIYRNALFHNLTGALKTAYPAVLTLVGADFFEGAAARYIRDYPSRSGNLQDYGAAFPVLLSDMPEAHDVPYLADVARLEWARQQAYLAADALPLPLDTVAGHALETHPETRLRLHPSVHLVESRYPVFDLWMYCQQVDPEPLSLDPDGQRVLVWRDGDQIALRAIDAPHAAFIGDVLSEIDLAHAVIRLTERWPDDFDLSSCLLTLFEAGLVTGCT